MHVLFMVLKNTPLFIDGYPWVLAGTVFGLHSV